MYSYYYETLITNIFISAILTALSIFCIYKIRKDKKYIVTLIFVVIVNVIPIRTFIPLCMDLPIVVNNDYASYESTYCLPQAKKVPWGKSYRYAYSVIFADAMYLDLIKGELQSVTELVMNKKQYEKFCQQLKNLVVEKNPVRIIEVTELEGSIENEQTEKHAPILFYYLPNSKLLLKYDLI